VCQLRSIKGNSFCTSHLQVAVVTSEKPIEVRKLQTLSTPTPKPCGNIDSCLELIPSLFLLQAMPPFFPFGSFIHVAISQHQSVWLSVRLFVWLSDCPKSCGQRAMGAYLKFALLEVIFMNYINSLCFLFSMK